MNASTFRRIALSFPETTERAHMNHPDFRVAGKIFATLGYPDKRWGMVRLTPEAQDDFLRQDPEVFNPCAGAWGRQGCTNVLLDAIDEETAKRALSVAWKNRAPAKLLAEPKIGRKPKAAKTKNGAPGAHARRRNARA